MANRRRNANKRRKRAADKKANRLSRIPEYNPCPFNDAPLSVHTGRVYGNLDTSNLDTSPGAYNLIKNKTTRNMYKQAAKRFWNNAKP